MRHHFAGKCAETSQLSPQTTAELSLLQAVVAESRGLTPDHKSARLLKYDVEDARRGKEESNKVGVGMYLARARARA